LGSRSSLDEKELIMLSRIIALALDVAVSAIAAGCNTMQGFGRDMERGGEKIQDKAERSK